MTQQKNSNLINESSLSRIYQHSQNHDIGTITAFRDRRDCDGEKYTTSEKRKRNKSLKAKLANLRYSVTPAKGEYIENYNSPEAKSVKEDIFIVVDIEDRGTLKKDLRKLGQEFEQDSILYIPKGGTAGFLIGTNNCSNGYPGMGSVIKLNNALFGKSGEFNTRVNGRPFNLRESTEEIILPPEGFYGRYACSEIARLHWTYLKDDEE
jgi:hypothetical protein